MLEKPIRADRTKVKHLRDQRGWTQEDLAKKMGCVKRTIENIEAGRPISRRTLMELEDAFGVERWCLRKLPTVSDSDTSDTLGDDDGLDERLIDAEKGETIAVVERTTTIDVVINRDFDSFSEKEIQHVLQAIRELISSGNDVRVVRKRRGSVILTLEMNPDDAECLLRAVKARKLSCLQVVDATLIGRGRPPSGSDTHLEDEGTIDKVLESTETEEVPCRRRGVSVRFRVVQGQPTGKLLLFPVGREFLFGRGTECAVRANSEWVSRQHCLLRVAQDRAVLCDLGSRNGTLVNGERLVGERQLTHYDQVQVGPLVFRVELEETDPTRASDAILTRPAKTNPLTGPATAGTDEIQAADTLELIEFDLARRAYPPRLEDRPTEDYPTLQLSSKPPGPSAS